MSNNDNGNNNDTDYEVGYKKPPKSRQFKKGQSGNPKGRSKKQQSTFDDDLKAVLEKEVVVTEGGKKITLTKRRLLLEQIVNKGAQGDTAMARLALPLLKIDNSDPDFEVYPEDKAALKAFMKRMEGTEGDDERS